MPTYQKCEPAAARGLRHTKVHAAYGMQPTMRTIAPADQRFKPQGIAPATWVYRRGKAGQGLVKAGAK